MEARSARSGSGSGDPGKETIQGFPESEKPPRELFCEKERRTSEESLKNGALPESIAMPPGGAAKIARLSAMGGIFASIAAGLQNSSAQRSFQAR